MHSTNCIDPIKSHYVDKDPVKQRVNEDSILIVHSIYIYSNLLGFEYVKSRVFVLDL
jgi:hypothetical protein